MFIKIRGVWRLFFTLNPHDIRSPISLILLQGKYTAEKQFSLNLPDGEADEYVMDVTRRNPRLLHELVAQNPMVATRCFHWTVRLVIKLLFNCADKPGVNRDNIAAGEVPGAFGHVRAYLGVVEPQMRKALHIHMLVQLLGFAHPDDIIGSEVLPVVFRRVWYDVASICFRSPEAFAQYLTEPAAMEALREQPFLPLTKKQRGMIGEARVREAQLALPGERRRQRRPARGGRRPARRVRVVQLGAELGVAGAVRATELQL